MTGKRSESSETRARLVQAALSTLRERGPGRFTLDAVAAEAGISKGGLLHHFPSKGALAEAVLRYRLERFEARVQEYLEQEPAGSGRWLRAYVRAAFDDEPVPIELWTLVMTLATEGASARAMLRGHSAPVATTPLCRWPTGRPSIRRHAVCGRLLDDARLRDAARKRPPARRHPRRTAAIDPIRAGHRRRLDRDQANAGMLLRLRATAV